MTDPHALIVSVDGSSKRKPRRGGVGVVFRFPDDMNLPIRKFSFPGYLGATADQMELKAAILAMKEVGKLKNLSDIGRILVHTDCAYVSENCGKAFFAWSRNKWRRRDGKPVDNAELWRELLVIVRDLKKYVSLEWHARRSTGDMCIADDLAKESAENPRQAPLGTVTIARPRFPKKGRPVHLPLHGQEVAIHITRTKFLSFPKKTTKYWFEIISEGHEHYGVEAMTYSRLHMTRGHDYEVLFGPSGSYPEVQEVLGEIEERGRGKVND